MESFRGIQFCDALGQQPVFEALNRVEVVFFGPVDFAAFWRLVSARTRPGASCDSHRMDHKAPPPPCPHHQLHHQRVETLRAIPEFGVDVSGYVHRSSLLFV
jgi:hypothetical protein